MGLQLWLSLQDFSEEDKGLLLNSIMKGSTSLLWAVERVGTVKVPKKGPGYHTPSA